MEVNPNHQVGKVLRALCEQVGTPRALAVHLLWTSGEVAQLQQLRCEPSDYFDAEAYWADALVTDFLRKADLPSGRDLESEAVAKFFALEAENKRTNDRLTVYTEPDYLFAESPEVQAGYAFIRRVRKEVRRILGPVPRGLQPRFSGGATMSDRSGYTTQPDKMSSEASFYPSSRWLLENPSGGFYESAWGRAVMQRGNWPREIRYNSFFTVPKDGTKRRGCAKEASVNVSFQLDVGRRMRVGLLRNAGICLEKGKERHMALAWWGSLTGAFDTLDESDASDLNSRLCTKLLLGDWYTLLDSLRATHTRVDNRLVRLEKFSSMGNGFTFELETVIFAAITRVVVADLGRDPDLVSVFGDDIVAPAGCARAIMGALCFLGFKPNLKKSFWEGPFRESCGGDYFDGVPVRAHFVETLPDEPQQWIALANGLRRVASGIPTRDAIVRRAWRICLDQIPSAIRACRGPETLGDLVIHDRPEFWKTRPCTVRRADYFGGHFVSDEILQIRCYRPVHQPLPWRLWAPQVQLASCLLGLSSAGVIPRDSVSGYRLDWVTDPGSTWLPS